MDVVLDSDAFVSRLARFQAAWDEGVRDESSPWYQVDAIVFLSGRQDDLSPTAKADQFHLWLFGYVFPETLLVVLRTVGVLKQLKHQKLVFLDKSTDAGNEAHIKNIFDAVEGIFEKSPSNEKRLQKLGRLIGKNEEAAGTFAEKINAAIAAVATSQKFQEVPMTDALALLLAVQDDKALACSTKAASLAVRLIQEVLIMRIEDILDNETQESPFVIASSAEKALDDQKKLDRWKTKFNLEPDCLDIIYVNVQSGAKCDLRPSAQPSTDPLYIGPGTILVSLGSKYQDYSANAVRTLLFNTKKEKRAAYQFTVETMDYGISLLTPGTPFKAIYDHVREFVEKKNPLLLPYLTRSMGHTLGLEYRESSLIFNGKSTAEGMVINISVGFGNIPSKDDNGETFYSTWLADTVEVRPAGEAPKVLTAELDKRLKSVNYELSDEPEIRGSAPPARTATVKDSRSANLAGGVPMSKQSSKTNGVSPGVKAKSAGVEASPPVTKKVRGEPTAGPRVLDKKTPTVMTESVVLRDRLRSRTKMTTSEDSEKLLERQKVLRQLKLEEIRERFKDGGQTNLSTNKRSVKKMNSLTAYRNASDYPKDLKPNRIHLDLINEAVIVPIPCSPPVPFHVSTIRNVFCQAEDKKFHTMRIQFQVPGSTGPGYKAENNPFPEISGPDGMFIKELIFRSSSPALPQLSKNIKELQKRIKQREENGVSSQHPLELNRKGGKRVLLKSVMVKTGTNNRRIAGTLEAHQNGLRFSGGRSENLDINYSNVDFAFFQPCENELLVLIHFRLKNPLLVNKKKTIEVQFYTEVGSQTDDLDQRRGRSSYDPDEIGEEQRERELKTRLNAEFKRFVESVEKMAQANGSHLLFELPYRELGFYGVPKNSSQLMLPTARCLVQLTEWPVFILNLSDIEIVSFERVYHGLRQFDIVFVFKDYTKQVRQITTVPIKALDTIKKWLNEMDIVWYESKGNLNWGEIFKTIREDVVGFVEDGAFNIFLGDDIPTQGKKSLGQDEDGDDESEDESETESEEDDEDYTAESSDYDDSSSNSDDEDDDDESLAAEDDSSDESAASDESGEEEGLTWEELERQAIQDDRKRGRSRDEDEGRDRHMKKKKRT